MFPLNANLRNVMLENTLICLLGRAETSSGQQYLVVVRMGSLFLNQLQLFNGGLLSVCATTWPLPWFSIGEEYAFSMQGLELLLAFQEFHFHAKACNVRYYPPIATPYNATPSKIIQYISRIFGSSMLQEFCS